VAIGPSVVEAESTAQDPDLSLQLKDAGIPFGRPERGARILERSKQFERFFDDKRTPLLADGKLGLIPAESLADDEHAKNSLPDALARWAERTGTERARARTGTERARARTDQSLCVPKADIVANGYDLSINRYKELIHEDIEHRDPRDLLKELHALEDEIRQGLTDLESML